MMTVTWMKRIGEKVYDKNVVTLAQKINDLGKNVKVSVIPGMMTVRGVGRYDEEKNQFLERNGFTAMEDYSFEDWRG